LKLLHELDRISKLTDAVRDDFLRSLGDVHPADGKPAGARRMVTDGRRTYKAAARGLPFSECQLRGMGSGTVDRAQFAAGVKDERGPG
jgi:hypothetical protein